jgi:hypothetical protein
MMLVLPTTESNLLALKKNRNVLVMATIKRTLIQFAIGKKHHARLLMLARSAVPWLRIINATSSLDAIGNLPIRSAWRKLVLLLQMSLRVIISPRPKTKPSFANGIPIRTNVKTWLLQMQIRIRVLLQVTTSLGMVRNVSIVRGMMACWQLS